MTYLVVITFDDPEEASLVRESLSKGEKGGYLKLDDSAVIVKDRDGKIHVRNELDRGVKIGAVGGGLIGLLVGSIFFPIGGLVVGLLGGALVGSLADMGVDQKFVKEVGEALQPNTSAIFFIVREADADYAIAALREYKGKVFQTSLPEDAEKALRDAIEKK